MSLFFKENLWKVLSPWCIYLAKDKFFIFLFNPL
jgi:hypothetical protein